jgi:hypothetical protein
METSTKYIGAFENFDQTDARVPVEVTPQETIDEIWKVINNGYFYCVISSYQPGTGPQTLAEDHELLRKDVAKLRYGCLEYSFGYSYSDGNGLTSVRKKSLVVPDMTYRELLSLGKKWNQETVAFGGKGGMSVVRVSDESVVMDFRTEDMRLAWNLLLTNQRNIPW